jgi:hypothetical protein
MSERTSLSSRHRRKSVPSYAASGASGSGAATRRSHRGGSVDPLLDSDDSGGNHSRKEIGHQERIIFIAFCYFLRMLFNISTIRLI